MDKEFKNFVDLLLGEMGYLDNNGQFYLPPDEVEEN